MLSICCKNSAFEEEALNELAKLSWIEVKSDSCLFKKTFVSSSVLYSK